MKYRKYFSAAFVVAFALQLIAVGQESRPSSVRFDEALSVMGITEFEPRLRQFV